jgi:hypothetical protein
MVVVKVSAAKNFYILQKKCHSSRAHGVAATVDDEADAGREGGLV